MSSIIKVGASSKRLNVQLKNPLETTGIETEREEIFFQRQIQQSYEKGFSDGQKSAFEKLEKEYKDKISIKYFDIDNIISSLDKSISGYGDVFEKVVIDLAVSIAEKILKREIAERSIINETLSEAVKKVLGSNKVLVKINPADLAVLNDGERNHLTDFSFSKIQFEPDERIERGGCFIETEIGNVDARISSQFSELKKLLEANIYTVES